MIALTLDNVMQDWASLNRPIIKPELSRGRERKWHIRLTEVWADPITRIGSSGLDEKVEWTYQTLRTWNVAHRISWDMWRFDSKHDAEKFITLYTLVWGQ